MNGSRGEPHGDGQPSSGAIGSSDASPGTTPPSSRPVLAILPWGLAFEDYLDPLGMTMEQFLADVTGGWLFNYVHALREAGIESVIVLVSAMTRAPMRGVHAATGARYVVLPAPLRLRWLRSMLDRTKGGGSRPATAPSVPPPTHDSGQRDGETSRSSPTALRPAGRWAGPLLWDLLRRAVTPTRALERTMRHEACAGILCQEYEDVRFDACVAVGRTLGIPVFATFQGGVPRAGTRPTAVRRRAMHACAGVIVGPAMEADRVRSAYGLDERRIARIPNPVDWAGVTAAERAEVRATLGVPSDVRLVGWHGRVARWAKGLDMLVQAWRALGEAPERRRLLLVGSGGDAHWLRGEVARELETGSIVWVDRFVRNRGEMLGYLSACDVYAFPSRHEGFPVAPLEAMALGLPVVAGAARGVSEILEEPERDGGIRVPGDDPGALAEALRALIDDPVRASALGAAARRRVDDHFSVAAVARRLGPWLAERGFPPSARAERGS